MLTNRARKYVIRCVKSAYFLGATPYRWDPKDQKVATTTSLVRKIVWFINCTFFVIYEAFLLYRLARITHEHEADTRVYTKKEAVKRLSELMNLRYKAITWFLPIAFQVATVVRWEQWAQFVNLYMRCFEKIQDKYVTQTRKKKYRSSIDKVGPYILYLGYLIATMQTLLHFRRPQQLALFSSMFPDIRKTNPVIRVGIALFHSYLIWSFTFLMQLYTLAMMAYISAAVFVLNELKFNTDNRCALTIRELRDVVTFKKVYVRMSCLHQIFNQVYSSHEIPTSKTALMAAVVLGIYGCVRLESIRSAQVAVVAFAALITLKSTYTGYANVFIASEETLETWRTRHWKPLDLLRNPELKVFLKSLQPLRTRVSYFYSVEKKSLVLIIIGVLLNQAVSVLVAF